MAHHQSAKKRIRQNEAKKAQNRYFAVTVRNAVRKLRGTKDKQEATSAYPKVSSLLDKLAKKNVIHKKKASNLKSKLALFINKLS